MTRQVLQYHPVVGHLYTPGIRARVQHEGGGYLVRTNQAGFRCDREFESAKRPSTRRVLLFGDSFVAGDGVSNGRRFGDVLEELIPDLEVYNYGLPGTGLDQQLLAFREAAAGIERDLVVVCVWLENILRVAAAYKVWGVHGAAPQVFAKPYFRLEDGGRLTLQHVPVPKQPITLDDVPPGAEVAASVRPAPDGYSAVDVTADLEVESSPRRGDSGGLEGLLRRAVRRLGPRAVSLAKRVRTMRRGPLLPGYERADHPHWLLMRAIIERWAQEAAPTPLLVIPIPMHDHVEDAASPRAYQQRFLELHDPPKLTVHDPLPDLRRYSLTERRGFRFELDFHPTPAGHRALAASIAPAVERLLPAKVEAPA